MVVSEAIQQNEQMKMRVKDKIAVITGAGSGIGKAAALKLAGEGAKICLVDLKNNRSEAVEEQIRHAGGEAFFADTDISNPQRIEHAIHAAADRWGRIDIVFANAGINGTLSPIEDLTPEMWDQTLNTNLKGTFLTVKYSVPFMKQNGGSIIITSSINGNRTFKNFGMAAYSTSKAGQLPLPKWLRWSWRVTKSVLIAFARAP